MREFLTVTALVVSLSGVVVSLAREEVRCYLGLNAESCQVQQPESPSSHRQEASSGTSEQIRDRKPSNPPPASSASSLSPAETSLKEDPANSVLTPSPDPNPVTDSPATQPLDTAETSSPAPTELKAAPEVTAPAPPSEQPLSARQDQSNQEGAAPSSSNIPLTVEPYNP